jgi:hypothetical protein
VLFTNNVCSIKVTEGNGKIILDVLSKCILYLNVPEDEEKEREREGDEKGEEEGKVKKYFASQLMYN